MASVQVEDIALDKIVPNEWNPNKMDDVTFNRLAREFEETGFIDPIQVIPLDNGTYKILGGEHRWQAAKVLGWETLPCILLTEDKWQDVDLQKFVTMRLNVLRGKTDPEKFMKMYDEMVDKYGDEALSDLMGFTDQDAWKKLTGHVGESLKSAGVPKEMVKEFEKTIQEVKTVDDLSNILNRLFTKYGDTLKYNYMVFTYGGKDHIYVQCDGPLWNLVNKLVDASRDHDTTATEVFKAAMTMPLKEELEKLPKTVPEAEGEA